MTRIVVGRGFSTWTVFNDRTMTRNRALCAVIGKHGDAIHPDAFDLIVEFNTAERRHPSTGRNDLPVQVPQFCEASIHICTEPSVQRQFVSIHLCMVESVESSLSKDRLTREQWIAHGLRTLARQGEGALKTGMLAEGLQVSRGSFYWHFESIADFRTQLLATWQERATDGVIREIDSAIVGSARLTLLMKLAFEEDRSLDRAFRSWAASDPVAAEVVATVDARRVAYIAKLLRESGVDARVSIPRAEFIYWAYIGQSSVMNSAHCTITEADLGDLSSLFTRPSTN